jgi:shikimate kinase
LIASVFQSIIFKLQAMTPTLPANKPIYLLGFMGSGKTYWGGQWARQTGLDFKDLDREIEKKLEASVASVFETKGEPFFRETEAEMLRALPLQPSIIACGGGTPCFHNNLEWMNASGTTIYLKASAAYLFENISAEPYVRPLLKNMNNNEIVYFIESKMTEREQYYNQATIILNVEEVSVNTLQELLQQQ